MREYFEEQKRLLLDQVSGRNPEVERKLKEAFSAALDSAFEDMKENGVQPDSEERFWKQLSQMLSDCGCLQYGYRYFENVADKVYLALENRFRCWPPQEDMEWANNASYVQVQRWDEGNRHKYFTLILPAEPEALQAYLQENGISSPQACRVLDVHIANNGRKELADILFDWQDIMALNYFFYRYGQLSEAEKKHFVLAADAQNIVAEKDLINLTANLDGLHIQEGNRSKEELGRFLVENDLCFIHFEDDMLPYLDYKKIAEKHMEETGGRLFREMYIENGTTPEEWVEIYDGTHLPDFTLGQEKTLEESREESPKETPGFGGGMTL